MTLRHIVAWKLAAEDAAVRAEEADEVARRLTGLQGVVPSIRSISAGRGLVEGNWDVAIVADFDDVAGLEAYQQHPAHQEVGAYVRGVVADRAAVDFEV